MDTDDILNPAVGAAVAITAAVLSPPVRRVVRRGAVYGLAGVLMAGDAISSFTQGVARGARQAAEAAEGKAQQSGSATAEQAGGAA